MILETGMVELQPSEFDLSALLAETRGRRQPLGDRHPIRVDAPEHLPLIADRERIEQVVVNLLSNAIRYSPEGGRSTSRWSAPTRRSTWRSATTGSGSPR